MTQQTEEERKNAPKRPAETYVRLKPFTLVMLVFALILTTAVVTFFALTVGDNKVVEVVSPNTKAAERAQFDKLYFVYDELEKKYFGDIDETKLVEGAINGMVDALGDPYTDYLDLEEAKQLNESISGSFEGIGAEVRESDGSIQIVSPIKRSPAEKAGLLPNDKVLEVDGTSLQGMSSSEAVLLIRGEKGSDVHLLIQRGEGEPFEVVITRDVIPIETVYGELVDGDVGHIRLTSFALHTYEEMVKEMDALKKEGATSFVIDVRQNPGGRLDTALKITDLFVEPGKTVFQHEKKNGVTEVHQASKGKKIDVPVALLIDEGSASASEILAGALKESTDYPIVGLTSFGKGTVQTPEELTDGSTLKLTTANWLTPEGNHIHEKGIAPDYEVDYPAYASLPFLNPSETYTVGSVGQAVETAEKMLDALGYDTGTVDGHFDEATAAAIRALQTSGDLEPSGILTGDTTFYLMDQLREKIVTDDPQLKKAIELLRES